MDHGEECAVRASGAVEGAAESQKPGPAGELLTEG